MQTAAPATAATGAARKVVTVLFADLTGSTALEERMDAESVRSILDRFYAAMRAEIERFGGRLVKFTGDGAMGAFGVPDVHEDDALRAVDAALAMREELVQLASDLQLDLSLKIGINTGEVVVSDADDDVVGDSVNVASRLEGAAGPGEILVGEETWRLTRSTSRYEPIAPLVLKGKSEPVPAYKLLSVDERTADSAAAPFVGRDVELGRLLSVFQDAVDANAARLVTIIGSPGLGKTRLARELMGELSDQARVRETRCDPAGESTFAPVADAIRAASGISETDSEEDVIAALASRLPDDDPDRERVATRAAAILGVGAPGSTEETFWAIRRLIEAAAATQPVVLVFDDIHWAEPLLLDLIEHLAEWIKDAPVLIVGTARPELRELRPSLVEGGRASSVVALEGLDRAATAQLALNLLGAQEEGLPSDLLAKIPASTEGNPLFVRELVRMLVDDGVLVRTPDGWNVTVDVEAIQVPPTITSLLSARVDRLRSDERTVVELASVVGKEFYRGALHDLAPAGVKDLVDGCLESLRRKELVEPVGTYWIDEPVYRFHHVLIRDAAYRRVLKETRADLHERVAEWLEQKTEDVLGEFDELVGYHLEQAHEYKQQLGRPDDALGLRAAELLRTAAQRALDRDDLPAAAALSGRALERLPFSAPERAELLLIRCEALLSMANVVDGSEAATELELIADSPRLRAWATCFAGHVANLTAIEQSEEIEARVAEAASELAALGDPAGAAKAHTVHAQALAKRGRFAECEAVLDDALTAARAANDRRRITATLGFAPYAALWGPNPVSRAGGRCLDIVRLLRITTGSPAVEATSLRCQAVLEAFRGRTDAARRMLRSARRTLTELGLEHELLEAEKFAGIVELVGDDPAAAVEHLRAAYEGFLRTGVEILAGESAALLARAHLRMGEDVEGAELIEASERLGTQDRVAQLAVKSTLLARQGSLDEARRTAEEAVELAERTDALFNHGTACRSLAEVLRAAGDADGARQADDRARALFERKGATALIETATTSATVVTPQSSQPEAANACSAAYDRLIDAIRHRDWPVERSMYSDNVVHEDRRAGLQSSTVGGDELVEHSKVIADLNTSPLPADHLATRGERLGLFRVVMSEASGLSVEVLQVARIDTDGKFDLFCTFDADDVDTAFAELGGRYLTIEPGAAPHTTLVNRCTRVVERVHEHINRGDLAAMTQLHSDDCVHEDRRAGLGMTISSLDEIERYWAEVLPGTPVVSWEIVATRGERLALFALLWEGARSLARIDVLEVFEIDESDRLVRVVTFDPSDRESAFGELDERFLSGEGAAHAETVRAAIDMARAFTNQDWDRIRQILADDLVVVDHRPAMLGEIHGADGWIESAKVLTSLVPYRSDLLAIHALEDECGVCQYLYSGVTSDGAAVDSQFQWVFQMRGGRVVRMEPFPVDELDAALVRFDELRGKSRAALGNRATDVVEQVYERMSAGDVPGALVFYSDDSHHEDRRAGLRTILTGKGERGRQFEQVVGHGNRVSQTVIATRGDRLALNTTRWTVGRSGYEVALLALYELADDGRIGSVIAFDESDLDEAIDELDERYATGEGSTAAEDIRPTSRVQQAWTSGDLTALRGLLTDDFVIVDHRPASLGSMGPDEWISSVRASIEISSAYRIDVTSYLRLAEGLTLVDVRWRGTTNEGAEYEIAFYGILLREGERFRRFEAFSPDHLDDAIARFEELSREDRPVLENLATRNSMQVLDCILRHDFEAARPLFAEGSVGNDMRSGVRITLRGVDERIEEIRSAAEIGVTRIVPTVVATRGDRLCLLRFRFMGSDEEPYEVENFAINEVDADGRCLASYTFDMSDLKGALEVLDERFIAGEGAAHTDHVRFWARFRACYDSRDWEGFRLLLTDDLVVTDHRPVSLGRIEGPDGFIAAMQGLIELVPGRRGYTSAVHGSGANVSVVTFAMSGATVDGVETTETMHNVGSFTGGRLRTFDLYPEERLGDALARFDELNLETPPLNNLAVRTSRAMGNAMLQRDWETLRSLLAEGAIGEDVRSGVRATYVGAEKRLEEAKSAADVGVTRIDSTVLAIRGDRLALQRSIYGGSAYETELLSVTEVDAEGRLVATIRFDPNDLDGGFAELDERFAVGEGSIAAEAIRLGSRLQHGMTVGDFTALRELLSDDFVLIDHRPASLGALDPEEWVASVRARVELSTTNRVDVVSYPRFSRELCIWDTRWRGTTDEGSEVESAYYVIFRCRAGLIAAFEVFASNELDEAVARFDELVRSAPPELDNLAVRTSRAFRNAFVDRDWDALAALLAEDATSHDLRSGVRVIFEGAEGRIQEAKSAADVGVTRVDSTVLATRGDRLCLLRNVFAGSGPGSFEVEGLVINEVGIDGRLTKTFQLDPNDLAGAFAELDERYLAGEGREYAELVGLSHRYIEAVQANDWDGLALLLTDDFVMLDHRSASFGEIRGRDAWMEAEHTWGDLVASGQRYAAAYYAVGTDGCIGQVIDLAVTDHGADVELGYFALALIRGGKISRIEMFADDELDTALARLEDLRAQTSSVLDNRALRVMRESLDAFVRSDMDACGALYGTEATWEDRRTGLKSLLEGREEIVRQIRETARIGADRYDLTPVATRGERLVLARLVYGGSRGGFEAELLELVELDDDGLIHADMGFDPDDLDVALDELDERYIAGEGAAFEGWGRGLIAVRHAWNDDHWDAQTLSDDIAESVHLVDNRPMGVGELHGRDAWIAFTSGLREASGELRTIISAIEAIAFNVRLIRLRLFGTNQDAGEVDLEHLVLATSRDGRRADRLEYFADDQLDAALARFAELGPREAARHFENAAFRTMQRWSAALERGDLDELTEIHTEDSIVDDRRKGLQSLADGRDACIANLRAMIEIGTVVAEFVPIATRGERLILQKWTFGGREKRGTTFGSELLVVNEIAVDGRHCAGVCFDIDDLAGAFAELDRRFIQGEGAPFAAVLRVQAQLGLAIREQDWERAKSVVAEGLVRVDHRLVSLGNMTADEWADSQRTLAELVHRNTPQVLFHRGLAPDRAWAEIVQRGTNTEGSDVEFGFQSVVQVREGKIVVWEVFPDSKTEEARALFESLGPRSDGLTAENECVRVLNANQERNERGDVEAATALFSSDCEWDDRRFGIHTLIRGREAIAENMRTWPHVGFSRYTRETIAVRGESLAVEKWRVEDDTGFESEGLGLYELDDSRLIRRVVFVDVHDVEEILDELDKRYVASEGAEFADVIGVHLGYQRAINARDWDTFKSYFAADVVIHDHRPATLGRTSLDELTEATKALSDVVESYRATTATFRGLATDRWWAELFNTGRNAEGGPVDYRFQSVGLVRDGKIVHFETFPLSATDDARALFEELGPRDPGGHWAPENAASRAQRSAMKRTSDQDWDALVSMWAPDHRLEDRRSGLHHVATSREESLDYMRSAAEFFRSDFSLTRLGSYGDRLALARVTVGDAATDRWTTETLTIFELDTSGLILRTLVFDADDLDAAWDEVVALYVAGEGRDCEEFVRAYGRIHRAIRARDWDALLDMIHEDYVEIDHRPVGYGSSPGSEGPAARIQAMLELAPDFRGMLTEVVAIAPDRALAVAREFGTSTDGVEFTLERLSLGVMRDGRFVRQELFPLEQRAEAIARFHELGEDADRHWAPENIASRLTERTWDRQRAQDWDAFTELYAPDIYLESRRKGLRDEVEGRDAAIEYMRAMTPFVKTEAVFTRIATYGERLALLRVAFGDPSVDRWTTELLNLYEIDDQGRMIRAISFDPDDVDAAFEELDRRHAEIMRFETDERRDILRAYNERDWETFRDLMHGDFEHVDHRPAGAGVRSGPDAYLQYVQSLMELAPDIQTYFTRILREEGDRRLAELRQVGHTTDGAEAEFHSLFLSVLRDGKLARIESFDPDDNERAIARFDELSGQRSSNHWAPENAASRAGQRLTASMIAQDWDATASYYVPDFEFRDLRTSMRFEAHGRDAAMEYMRSAATITRAGFVLTRLAVAGERLALVRLTIGDEAQDRWTSEMLVLYSLNEDGLFDFAASCDVDDLDTAFDMLNDRLVEGEGRAYRDFLETLRRGLDAFGRRDWDEYRAALDDSFVQIDHRPASAGTVHGPDAHLTWVKSLPDLADDARFRAVEIIRLAADRGLGRAIVTGTTNEGASVESPFLMLCLVREGRIAAFEQFAVEDRDAAIARFDELSASAPTAALGNEAVRRERVITDACARRDFESYRALLAEDFVLEDRRPGLAGRVVGPEENVAHMQRLIPGITFVITPIATRGERLFLGRGHASMRAGFEVETLGLHEFDEHGLAKLCILFDADDLDGAFDELDDRYIAGEGAVHPDLIRLTSEYVDAYNVQDWDRIARLYPPDFVLDDHRPASAGQVIGGAAVAEYLAGLTELMQDVSVRLIGMPRIGLRGGVAHFLTRGTSADGGSFEFPWLSVATVRNGTFARADIYPIDRYDDATARFDELALDGPPSASSVPDNFAFRSVRRGQAIALQGDWDGLSDRFADDVYTVDRRSGLGSRVEGKEAVLAHVRAVFESGTDLATELIATRGERLDLSRESYSINDFTVEALRVSEVDEDGRTQAIVIFDPDDLDAAFDELDERFADGEGTPHADVFRALTAVRDIHQRRDWDRWRSSYTDDFEVVDHRPAGWGVIRGANAWTEHSRAAVDVMPDALFRYLAIHSLDQHGAVGTVLMTGTNSTGGEVELIYTGLMEFAGGETRRLEIFPLEQLDAALARFEELRPGPRRELENLVTRQSLIFRDAMFSGDWEPVRTAFAEDIVAEDRRRGIGSRSVGLDAFINNFRTMRELGFRSGYGTVLATRGDRLELRLGAATDADGNVMEALTLSEANEAGLISTQVYFDTDALDEATRELEARYLEGEGAPYAATWRVVTEFLEAHSARDWAAIEAMARPGFVAVNHRPASWGTIDDPAEFIRTIRALTEVAPDVRQSATRIHAIADGIVAFELCARGSTPDGVEVEIVNHVVTQSRDGYATDTEMFPEDQLDAAIARYHELATAQAADVDAVNTTVLENDATRASDRFAEAFARRDWEAIDAGASPELVRDDRRAGFGGLSGKDVFIEGWKVIAQLGFDRIDYATLAIRGARLCLRRAIATGSHGFESELLAVIETDHRGHGVRIVYFDVDQINEAFDELDDRYLESGDAASSERLAIAVDRTISARDWPGFMSLLAEDVVFVSHHPVDLGSLSNRDALLENARVFVDVVPNVRFDARSILSSESGVVIGTLWGHGTDEHGNEVEFEYVMVIVERDGRLVRVESFPPEQRDQATARFDELAAEH